MDRDIHSSLFTDGDGNPSGPEGDTSGSQLNEFDIDSLFDPFYFAPIMSPTVESFGLDNRNPNPTDVEALNHLTTNGVLSVLTLIV